MKHKTRALCALCVILSSTALMLYVSYNEPKTEEVECILVNTVYKNNFWYSNWMYTLKNITYHYSDISIYKPNTYIDCIEIDNPTIFYQCSDGISSIIAPLIILWTGYSMYLIAVYCQYKNELQSRELVNNGYMFV